MEHMKKDHKGSQRCPFCDFKYKARSGLANHLRKHFMILLIHKCRWLCASEQINIFPSWACIHSILILEFGLLNVATLLCMFVMSFPEMTTLINGFMKQCSINGIEGCSVVSFILE